MDHGTTRVLPATGESIPSAPSESPLGSIARPLSRRRRELVLLCCSGVSFMIMLDTNVVAVSLPAIARDLQTAFSGIEWVVSAYVLAFAALLMSAGALADRYGRRRTLLAGLALFTLASFLCGVAPTSTTLELARAIQGVGAALQLSAAVAVLGHEFRGPERARAFAFWGTTIGVAGALGPPIGGLITSGLGWRWAFLINVPVGAALLALAVASLEESGDPDAQRLDFAGMASFGTGLLFLIWALIDANADGWTGRATLLKLGMAAGSLAIFAVAESVQDRPMVDLGLFRKPTFLGSAVAMVGFAAAAQVMMTYLPLYLQNAFGLSPALAGLGMLPFALPFLFCPPLAGALATRITGRSLLTAGLVVVALGNGATGALSVRSAPYWAVALGMALTGCGAGLLNGETTRVLISAIPAERSGMASGIGGTTRFVGLVTSVTGLGAILAGETARRFAAGIATLPSLGPAAASQALVSRIVAGDAASVAQHMSGPQKSAFLDVARASFASGFSTVLFVAGLTAATAAALTYLLVRDDETSPVRALSDSERPGTLD